MLGPEVHVEPFASGCLRTLSSEGDDLGCDASTLVVASCLGVEEEGMVPAVPSHIDGADEHPAAAGSHPAEAVLPDPLPPVGDGGAP